MAQHLGGLAVEEQGVEQMLGAGVFVPQDMTDAMEEAAKSGVARERGIELAARVVKEMQGICQGVHIMAIGWEAGVPDILRSAGIRN